MLGEQCKLNWKQEKFPCCPLFSSRLPVIGRQRTSSAFVAKKLPGREVLNMFVTLNQAA
jgi:hypothetical protein